MKNLFAITLSLCITSAAHAVSWSYQVNSPNQQGVVHQIDSGRNTFEAGPHNCEVSPISVKNNTEFRTLMCGLDTYSISTGGLCTQKGSKISTVQYAILNVMGPKHSMNVVLSCKF
jgi:hypothetical protein